MKPLAAALFILAAAVAVTAGSRLAHNDAINTVDKSAVLMGTFVNIKVPVTDGLSRADAAAAIDKAMDEIRRVERLFSVYMDDSEISRLNRAKKGEAVKIEEEAFSLIERSADFSLATDGAFDITVKPLVDLWSEARRSGKVPSDEEVRSARSRVGFRDLILDRGERTVAFGKDAMALDMGAVAKGYAADMAARTLAENGVRNAIVGCGGDMRCLGVRSPGKGWKVGIRHPRDKGRTFMDIVLSDAAVDTSGDYEKFFIAGGRRFSHIIDPRTGYPAEGAVSATVVSDDSVTSDAFATALCVLGSEGLRRLADTGPGGAIIISYKNGGLSIDTTKGFKERYHAIKTADIR